MIEPDLGLQEAAESLQKELLELQGVTKASCRVTADGVIVCTIQVSEDAESAVFEIIRKYLEDYRIEHTLLC